MSIFQYPRINFKGTIQLNPGTANNDDYASNYALPDSWGPFAGVPLALIDSKTVQARTYGMSDEAFRQWVQKAQTFDVVGGTPGQTAQVIPAEWNYYGGMDMNIVAAQVIGVRTGSGKIHCRQSDDEPLTDLLGADLTFSGGHITDVNSEGSPPATQFFIDGLTLTKDGKTLISGSPSKGACQWLNFYRNVNLTADGGAGGYVYHVIRKSQAGTAINIPGFQDPKIVGVILRYYLYRPMESANTNQQIEALYQQQQTNPATLEIAGTLAPLYEDEHILTTPTGRLLVSNQAQIPTPAGSQNNSSNGLIALAPAVLQRSDNIISADFVGTFPDYYQAQPQPANPKYDFGEVSLVVSAGLNSAVIGAVEYANTTQGDREGWVFDFDISANKAAQQVLEDADATFKLVHSSLGNILEEADYYFVSNQQAIYAEQFETGSLFLNQGTHEPASVSVFRRGQELSAAHCPPITIWQYRSIPLQDPGNAIPISTSHKPGQPIVVDTSQPGNFLFTFSVNDKTNPSPAGYPPKSYSAFMNPPFITNAPSISLRILPNGEDFSRYYVDPSVEEPSGNDLLTFEVVYEKVLRTYYLLYPVMIPFVRLNSEKDVAKNAQGILHTTKRALWMSNDYMPRTRDMSASRTRLLRAWCRKVL
ncbi:MAG TPA: hypothetical protein VHU19_00245 [Pyrinomonadaceae bacterium]|jgi:hypothetical protein|nr:hypothetical protein [Pyrinomonadaceae bacterium]